MVIIQQIFFGKHKINRKGGSYQGMNILKNIPIDHCKSLVAIKWLKSYLVKNVQDY